MKHTRYIFDIPIPFSHHLYLSATIKECFTGFACEVTPRPYCLQVSAAPNSYVPFYWLVILILNGGAPQQVFANYNQYTTSTNIIYIYIYIYHASKGYQYYGEFEKVLHENLTLEIPPFWLCRVHSREIRIIRKQMRKLTKVNINSVFISVGRLSLRLSM